MQDEFIGSKFDNLEVIGWFGDRTNGSKLYTLICHKCKEDTELFGDGTFYSTKHQLHQGKRPCGCGKSPRWSEYQNLIRVKRICASNNWQILGIEQYRGVLTNIILKCPIDNNTWNSNFKRILAGTGCKKCANNEKAKTDQHFIELIKNNNLTLSNVDFWRSKNKDSSGKDRWCYKCDICSLDEFVQHNLCSGVFESDIGNLIRGGISCRCSSRYNWTREQREYQINKILSGDNNLNFICWEKPSFKYYDKIMLECKEHQNTFLVGSGEFITQNRGCPKCVSHGFKKHLPAFVYVLSIEKDQILYTGFGITNEIEVRLAAHKRELNKSGYDIADYYFINCAGSSARCIEEDIKSKVEITNLNVDGFKREATTESFENVVTLLKSIANKEILIDHN